MKTANILLIMLLCGMVSGPVVGQIPNNGFEEWVKNGDHFDPVGWWTTNEVVTIGTHFPATRSLDHYPPEIGTYSLRLENKPELYPDWNAMGIAWTGAFEGNDKPVFAVTGHPTTLWGYFKFFPENQDTFEIHVRLYKNGQDISGGSFKTGALVPEWTPFHLVLSEYTEADSGRILLSSCFDNEEPLPKGNSVLYIDNLSFDQLITGSTNRVQNDLQVGLFPNPARDELDVSMNSLLGETLVIEIMDGLGRGHIQKRCPGFTGKVTLDVSALRPGNYFIRIGDGHQVVFGQSLIIQP